MNRLERYEERLRDPTSKEARQKAACEARRRSTGTTLSDRRDKVDAKMESLYRRLRDIERWNAMMAEALGVRPARERRDQPGKHRAETNQYGNHRTEGAASGVRSLGTIALKGRN